MKTVRVAELKAHLSAHLRMASAGEEVLVLDRNTPIARIVPVGGLEYSDREKRLIAKGVLTPPSRPPGEPRYVPNPVKTEAPITKELMDAIWEEIRSDRV
jgi:antitoxin (DNA-binding transcriptional repressor) of toxin-antitoxin stability system